MDVVVHWSCLISPDVAATGFAHEPGLERLDGLHPPSEQIEAPPAALAETPHSRTNAVSPKSVGSIVST